MNNEALNDILTDVLNCACTALESGVCLDGDASPCGCPCRRFISTGPPAWDQEACCSDGQLTAYVERIYPYKLFPSQTGEPSVCSTELAVDVVVTLLRCYPAVLKEDGSSPTASEINAASEAVNRDLLLLTKAVICCLSGKRSRLFIFTGGRTIGPDGGCVGVEARFTLQVAV